LNQLGNEGVEYLLFGHFAAWLGVRGQLSGFAPPPGLKLNVLGWLEDAGGTLRQVDTHQEAPVAGVNQTGLEVEAGFRHANQAGRLDRRARANLLEPVRDLFERTIGVRIADL
jgi:hypothetical protein